MFQSRLQEPFMQVVAASFHGVQAQIMKRLARVRPTTRAEEEIIENALKTLYHTLFVTFDGGTALAEVGSVRIVDGDGQSFDQGLHEMCLTYWEQEDNPFLWGDDDLL